VIEVQHLSKHYGPVKAVDDVSFRAEQGEILGFLGPNGAGKTTTMRIITGYMPATEGKASVAGFDVFDQPLEAKRRTGYLPETPPLYPDMTVREYLNFVAKIKGVRKDIKGRVDAVMKKTWVSDMANRHCAKLSKGYKQRVGLAQALIHNPDVLVLDEPTAGLDPKQIIETRQLIRELAGSHTIILSTHILPEVAQTCQKVVIINKGKVVAIDTPDALTERSRGAQTLFVQAYGPADAIQGVLQSLPGVVNVSLADASPGSFHVDSEKGTDIRRDVAAAIVRGGWGLLELRPMRMSLEDIFLSLTTEENTETAAQPAENTEAAANA
jgi:gliding motility-associated transport system ATP-binding protein